LQEDYAFVETLVGETDSAVKRLTFLLTIPSDVSMNLLRADPMWDGLRPSAASNGSSQGRLLAEAGLDQRATRLQSSP
jgi:hypothetical protein